MSDAGEKLKAAVDAHNNAMEKTLEHARRIHSERVAATGSPGGGYGVTPPGDSSSDDNTV